MAYRFPVTIFSSFLHGTPNYSDNYDGNVSTTTFSSNSFQAGGYYGQSANGTVFVYPIELIAQFIMQGTLLNNPSENDWVDIPETFLDGTTLVNSQNQPLNTPTAINFTGNFVLVRATIRNFTGGAMSKVVYSF